LDTSASILAAGPLKTPLIVPATEDEITTGTPIWL
jgi:hypothetical protein